jgi:tRNA threonylcarbamoyladenosine biosynthesis protein TsaE
VTATVGRAHIITHSAEETEALGRRLGARLQRGDVVALIGPLGAGKTVLARGITAGAGASGYVASPSFVIIRDYAGPVPVHHADLYRLERAEEIADLGLDDLADDGILIVEWADRAPGLLPGAPIHITLAFGDAETDRVVTVVAAEE